MTASQRPVGEGFGTRKTGARGSPPPREVQDLGQQLRRRSARTGRRIVTPGGDKRTSDLGREERGAESPLPLRGAAGQPRRLGSSFPIPYDPTWGRASFSPDGSRIRDRRYADFLSEGVGRKDRGAEVLSLKGHASFIRSASFSPDGSRVVTGSSDKTAKVWDAKTGAEILTLKGHAGAVTTASFSPDGSADRVGRCGPDGHGLAREGRCPDSLPQSSHRHAHVGDVQPGWVADRDRKQRPDSKGVGREVGRRDYDAQGACRYSRLGVIQPGRILES